LYNLPISSEKANTAIILALNPIMQFNKVLFICQY
jgi:hypothetical protein